MENLPAVMLIVTIITSSYTPNVTYKEPMPSVKICLEEAERFLNTEFPEFIVAQAVSAQCIAKREKQQEVSH
jgi:hypothetical protein